MAEDGPTGRPLGKPGRKRGKLQGLTPEANDLGQFLRTVVGDRTLKELSSTFGYGKGTTWAGYLNGSKIISEYLVGRLVEKYVPPSQHKAKFNEGLRLVRRAKAQELAHRQKMAETPRTDTRPIPVASTEVPLKVIDATERVTNAEPATTSEPSDVQPSSSGNLRRLFNVLVPLLLVGGGVAVLLNVLPDSRFDDPEKPSPSPQAAPCRSGDVRGTLSTQAVADPFGNQTLFTVEVANFSDKTCYFDPKKVELIVSDVKNGHAVSTKSGCGSISYPPKESWVMKSGTSITLKSDWNHDKTFYCDTPIKKAGKYRVTAKVPLAGDIGSEFTVSADEL
ncbi:hypothetical protein [Streptomyces microflavus]|uniref:hypothetical protein n=1 Tax=Streptomyces microflavus TaxID=1919 RepID=UPI0033BB8F09